MVRRRLSPPPRWSASSSTPRCRTEVPLGCPGGGTRIVRTWMLLVYKVPNEPTAARVYVWRKLKRLAAVLLHDAVWVLPATPHTREQLRWLAAEIVELNGEATVWESRLATGDEDRLVDQFASAVESAYREVLAGMKSKDADLAALSRR